MAAPRCAYRRLGRTSLLVSELSLGTWVTFDASDGGQVRAAEQAYELMALAYARGVNLFDNAEAYAWGDAERLMGAAVRLGVERGTWNREDLVLTTKIFFGSVAPGTKGRVSVNRVGLSRKHVVEGLRASLRRMKVDYVDVVYCHRFDPLADMEETVRAFNFLLDQGLCFYWGTSEWTAEQIAHAKAVAERLGMVGPCVEQPEYNLFNRRRVEVDYAPLYSRGLGLTTWSPLASGVLTGKYANGVPEGSRLALPEFRRRPDYARFTENVQAAERLRPLAEELGCSMGQLALAWCLANPNVSSVIMGASSAAQLEENLDALRVLRKLSPEWLERVDTAMGTQPALARSDQQVQFRVRSLRPKL